MLVYHTFRRAIPFVVPWLGLFTGDCSCLGLNMVEACRLLLLLALTPFLQGYAFFLSKPINHIWSVLVLLSTTPLSSWLPEHLWFSGRARIFYDPGRKASRTFSGSASLAPTAWRRAFGVGSTVPLLQMEHELSTFIPLKKVQPTAVKPQWLKPQYCLKGSIARAEKRCRYPFSPILHGFETCSCSTSKWCWTWLKAPWIGYIFLHAGKISDQRDLVSLLLFFFCVRNIGRYSGRWARLTRSCRTGRLFLLVRFLHRCMEFLSAAFTFGLAISEYNYKP